MSNLFYVIIADISLSSRSVIISIIYWRQHDIIMVTIYFDTMNMLRGRSSKLILGCEMRGNYKNKGKS